MAYTYNWPMASIGTSAIFYFPTADGVKFLLQHRHPQMHNGNKLGACGGYLEVAVEPCGKHETLAEGLLRELEEEMGAEFVNALPQNVILDNNFAFVRHKPEAAVGGGFQTNFNFTWFVPITEEIAHTAIIGDPSELTGYKHLLVHELKQHNVVPWVQEYIQKYHETGYFNMPRTVLWKKLSRFLGL